MKDTLKKFLSPRGDILSDDRSNQLIVRDIPSVIPTIDNLIRQLDRKSQQVEIEARVISASRSFAQDIGVQWGFAGSTTSGRSIFGGNPAVGTSPVQTGPGLPQPPLVSGGSGSSNGLPFNELGSRCSNKRWALLRARRTRTDIFISAAESKGVASRFPSQRSSPGNNARPVKQGTKIPIQTTINNTISVQYIDAVLKLEVTHRLRRKVPCSWMCWSKTPRLTMASRVQEFLMPDTQSAETKVPLPTAYGGDRRNHCTQQRTDVTQVPVVGSLSLIGYLSNAPTLRCTARTLVLLTPRIFPARSCRLDVRSKQTDRTN
jgi:type IV pilus assembly protein PilQ